MAFWRPGEPERLFPRKAPREVKEIIGCAGPDPAGASHKKKAPASQQEAGADTINSGYCSGRFNHGAGTDTTGANTDMHAIATGGGHSYPLQIRQPTPSVLIVGMAYIIAGGRAFSTNRTFF